MRIRHKDLPKQARFRPLKTAGTLVMAAFFSFHALSCNGGGKMGDDDKLKTIPKKMEMAAQDRVKGIALAPTKSPEPAKPDSEPKIKIHQFEMSPGDKRLGSIIKKQGPTTLKHQKPMLR